MSTTDNENNVSDHEVETPATPVAETATNDSDVKTADSTAESVPADGPQEEQVTYFEDLALSDDVLDALYDMRFEKCTPVQAACIPPILEHHDVLGVAQTGTGKTAAYLLPLLTLLGTEPHPADAVNCLVIAPTRELARQIDQALQGFAYYTGVNAVAVVGTAATIEAAFLDDGLEGGAVFGPAGGFRLLVKVAVEESGGFGGFALGGNVEKEAGRFSRSFQHFKRCLRETLLPPEGGLLAGRLQKAVRLPVSVKGRRLGGEPNEVDQSVERVVFPMVFDEVRKDSV